MTTSVELNDERGRKYRIAQIALKECNKIHAMTGWEKISLEDVADSLDISKKEIVDGFKLLVQDGIIEDDGDYDHLNYRGAKDLLGKILTSRIDILWW